MTPLRQEFLASLQLALPIVSVQVGMLAMGTVDVMMVGRVSDEALGAIALGDLYAWGIAVFGLGLLTVLDGVIAQAVGADDKEAIGRTLRRGVILAVGLAIPITTACLFARHFLTAMGQPEELIAGAHDYVLWLSPSILPLLLFSVLRTTLQAQSRVAPVVWTILAANLVNLGVNWLLVFGHWGFPAMGLRGAALATLCSRWLMVSGLITLGIRDLLPHLKEWSHRDFRWSAHRRLIRLGAPLGFQFLLEMSAFATTALMVGWISAKDLAGHQVAIKLASLTFMVPLGVSIAASVRVGQAIGRKDHAGTRQAAGVNLVLGTGAMAVFSILLIAFPGSFAAAYTNQEVAQQIAASLMPIAGVFQVFDGIQVVCVGILRGTAETRTAALVNLLGFWGVGIPVGYLLAFPGQLGAKGLWWGLVAGLGAVALVLAWRVQVRLRRPIERVLV